MAGSGAAGVLVVGAGQAAVELIRSLRKNGYADPITLIGDEPHLPYDRPPLSKAMILGTQSADRLAFLSAKALDDLSVSVRLGRRIEEIDGAAREARDSAGEVHRYATLVLATGASAVPSPWPHLPGVHTLRTLDDAQALRRRLEDGARDVLVVGGGFLGLEVASSLRTAGCGVTVVEAGPRLLAGRASDYLSRWLLERHAAEGNDIRLGTLVVDVEPGPRVRAALSDGTTAEADTVVFAVGARAEFALAEGLGLRIGRGILTDEVGRTSLPGVYAIGDVASLDSAEGELRVESVQHATASARAAAREICGLPAEHPGPPTFWTQQFGERIQIAGVVPPGAATTEVVSENDQGGWAVRRESGGVLLAVEALNDPRSYLMAVRELGATTTGVRR